MNNKQKLFECFGGNNFRIIQPQAMGMMAETTSTNKVRLTLVRKPETNEFLVKVFINGKYSEDATYYTDDKQDALNTAKLMAQQYVQQGFELEKGKTVQNENEEKNRLAVYGAGSATSRSAGWRFLGWSDGDNVQDALKKYPQATFILKNPGEPNQKAVWSAKSGELSENDEVKKHASDDQRGIKRITKIDHIPDELFNLFQSTDIADSKKIANDLKTKYFKGGASKDTGESWSSTFAWEIPKELLPHIQTQKQLEKELRINYPSNTAGSEFFYSYATVKDTGNTWKIFLHGRGGLDI